MKIKKVLYLILFLLFINTFVGKAQVTIGFNEDPASGALLQLKEVSDQSGTTANATKGLLMPRVELTNPNELYPMFEQSSGSGVPTAEYVQKKPGLDKSHTGLIVYNVKVTNYFCPGLYVWDGQTWQPLSEEMHNECK